MINFIIGAAALYSSLRIIMILLRVIGAVHMRMEM